MDGMVFDVLDLALPEVEALGAMLYECTRFPSHRFRGTTDVLHLGERIKERLLQLVQMLLILVHNSFRAYLARKVASQRDRYPTSGDKHVKYSHLYVKSS